MSAPNSKQIAPMQFILSSPLILISIEDDKKSLLPMRFFLSFDCFFFHFEFWENV